MKLRESFLLLSQNEWEREFVEVVSLVNDGTKRHGRLNAALELAEVVRRGSPSGHNNNSTNYTGTGSRNRRRSTGVQDPKEREGARARNRVCIVNPGVSWWWPRLRGSLPMAFGG